MADVCGFHGPQKGIPKDPYPLPNFERLVHGPLGLKALSFMDVYIGYNQVRMSPNNAPKVPFMTNQNNNYNDGVPFELKNAEAT